MSALPGPRADVGLMAGYHSPQLEVRTRLNTNEAPEPPPSAFTAAVAEELTQLSWHRYPDRRATALREALAAHHRVDPAQVFPANGSNEVLQGLLLAYAGPDRTVVTFEPTYALHAHIARVVGSHVVEGERADDFSLDLDEVRRVVADAEPSVVFLCSPNNPTGMVDAETDLVEIIDLALQLGFLLVVDEAYGQFAPHSALSHIADDVPLVVTRTFSKTWSMAAARLGYLVAPRPVVEACDKVVLPYHLDALKQAAGRVALRFDAEMRARVEALVAERVRLVAGLGRLDVDLWPSAANFVLFRPRPVPGSEVWQRLVERSVLVRDCSGWPRLEGCLRVTVGSPAEDDHFLAELAAILEEGPRS